MSQYLIAHIGHTTKWQEHVCWWKPNSCGYTICIDKAGRYSEAEARSICQHGECIAVPVACAEGWALSTPYYRKPNGTLAKLYDGGQQWIEMVRPVVEASSRVLDWLDSPSDSALSDSELEALRAALSQIKGE